MNACHTATALALLLSALCPALWPARVAAQPVAPHAAPPLPQLPPVPPPAFPAASPAPAAPANPAAPAAPAAALPPSSMAPFTGEGRSYTPGEFNAIEISGAAHVRFRQGEPDGVFVEGDEDAQKAVSLEVRRGQLVIRPSGGWKFWNNKRVNVTVTARNLQRVNISGAADLLATAPVNLERLHISISGAGLARFDQLKAGQLNFHVSGAGDGQMAGQVGELSVSVSGRSEFRGEDLMAQTARVRVSGIAEVKVWVVQELQVSVSGVGTVDHWGGANVQRSSAGIARINSRGPKAALP